MFEIVQVTAQYSNAVLVAILPHISSTAQKLELPMPLPVTPAHVRSFKCSWRSDQIGGSVRLTNGYQFSFTDGHISYFAAPQSYFAMQDPDEVPNLYGSVKVNETAAVSRAREAIKKLGFNEKLLHADKPPIVTKPITNGASIIPRYRVQWSDLDAEKNRDSFSQSLVEFEIDAETKQIRMMALLNTNTFGPQPKIDVKPPIIGTSTPTRPSGVGRKVTPASAEYAQAFLNVILPQLNEYVSRAGVSAPRPITTNHIDMARYDCGFVEGSPRAFIDLKSGARFVYSHGQVTAFYAANVMMLPGGKDKPAHEFYGPLNMTTDEALALIRKTVKALGYSEKVLRIDEPPTDVGIPPQRGTNRIARCFVNWQDPQGPFRVVAEVDVSNKVLTSLYINDHANTNIWRNSPLIPGEAPPSR